GCEFAFVLDEFLVVVGISDAVEIATVNSFGFVVLGDGDCFEPFLAGRDVNVAAHEVHEVSALQKKLSHPGVIVVLLRDVAVATLFGFFCADRVGNEGRISLTGKSRSGDSLLSVVEPFAVGVLRADENRATRTCRRDAMAGYGAIYAEHIDIVA